MTAHAPLLPCPAGHQKGRLKHDDPDEMNSDHTYSVVCQHAPCGWRAGYWDTAEEAIAAWNTRAPAVPPDVHPTASQLHASVKALKSLSPQPASPWSFDMSSAPRDGTEILLGNWRDGRWFHVEADRWRSYATGGAFWHAWSRHDFNPTHWMPMNTLPAPPSPPA